jgi:WD40 repeat protein
VDEEQPMSQRVLTCPCGHTWEQAESEPLPADLSTICPVCSANRVQTLTQEEGDDGGKEAPTLRLEAGQVLGGFEVLEEINRGGMGVIYKARQQGLNRLVALKVISPERLGSPSALKRFQREVQAAALLSHPNIVTVYHTDLGGRWPYLAMEYVPGIDLLRLVRTSGPLTIVAALDYVSQAAHGLQHAFEQGLVHRDIKPANLMVSPSPLDKPAAGAVRRARVKILDLGLARVMTAGETVGSTTHAGMFLGTPDYISPEQAEDPRRADVRSDLYSLGCTLYFLLVGEAPFANATLVERFRRQLTEPPPSAAARRPDVPLWLDGIVLQLTARDPAHRFQTPEELLQAIELGERAPVAAAPVKAAPAPPATTPSVAPRDVQAHAGGVRALCLSPDGAWLLSGGVDETLCLWGADRLQEVRRVVEGVGPVEDVALAPDGKWAASCALRLFREDMVVQMWDLPTAREAGRLGGFAGAVHCVALSADGRRLAAGGADRTIRIWSVAEPGTPALCLRGHTAPVSRVLFLPAGDSLLSGGLDGTVRHWDSRTGALKGGFLPQVGPVRALAFSQATKRIAAAGEGLRIRQRDGALLSLGGHHGLVSAVAFSPDGQFLLSGGNDGTVRLWKAGDGEEVARYDGRAGQVHAVAIHSGGRVAFLGYAEGILRRWPLPDLRPG